MNNNLRTQVVVWTIKDILIVGFFVFITPIIFYLLLRLLFGYTAIALNFQRYVQSGLLIVVPVLWLRKKYGLNKESLGLRKDKFNSFAIIVIAIGTAVIYYFVIMSNIFHTVPTAQASYVDVLFAPISINGFPIIILAPIGEEMMYRGFLYGYLRNKIGVVLAIILQAALFSICHVSLFYYPNVNYLLLNIFLSGLIFGLLYEKTGSLYTSIICHGCINYIALIKNVRIG
jgi:membrane protease YdiL (CAAX protease family)